MTFEYTPLNDSELIKTIAGAYPEHFSEDDVNEGDVRDFISDQFAGVPTDKLADLMGRLLMMTPTVDNFQTEQQEHSFEGRREVTAVRVNNQF